MKWLHQHARQAGWLAAKIAQAMRVTGHLPNMHFVAEAAQCPLCDGASKVYKNRSRQVITMQAGAFQAIEKLKQCAEDPTHAIMHSNALAQLVPPALAKRSNIYPDTGGGALLLRQGMCAWAWCAALSDAPDYDRLGPCEASRRNCPTRLGGEVIQAMATMNLSVLQEISHVR